MSDQDQPAGPDQKSPGKDEPSQEPPAETSAASSVTKGTLIILLVILLSLTWYLFADRFTPYTS